MTDCKIIDSFYFKLCLFMLQTFPGETGFGATSCFNIINVKHILCPAHPVILPLRMFDSYLSPKTTTILKNISELAKLLTIAAKAVESMVKYSFV